MNKPRLALLITAFAFLAFGLVAFFSPEMEVGPMGVMLPVPLARAELRAFYGGAQIGLAIFFFVSARRPAFFEAATLLGTLILSCIAITRAYGMVIEFFVNPTLIFAGTLELCGAALNFWAYRSLKRE